MAQKLYATYYGRRRGEDEGTVLGGRPGVPRERWATTRWKQKGKKWGGDVKDERLRTNMAKAEMIAGGSFQLKAGAEAGGPHQPLNHGVERCDRGL